MAQAPLNLPYAQTFAVGGTTLYARRWGRPGGTPLIALHGWLDNAATFDLVAPLLGHCDLICLDCAGHGKSGHRTHLGAYNIWQDVGELFAVADHLGWESFNLLGHSRGAMISFLAAGTFPSRIMNLFLVDGGVPRIAEPEQAPELLAESIQSVRLLAKRSPQYHPTFARAVAVRANSFFPLAASDAEILARHGVQETPDGFFWSYDPKLYAGSEVRFSLRQLNAFCDRITANTLVVLGEQGLVVQEPQALELLSKRQWRVELLPGGHHLHMHEQAPAVAKLIYDHLALSRPA